MKASRGFTLAEMVVSMVLLLLIIFSLGLLIPYSKVRMHSTIDRDMAYMLADNMIERIRVLSFDDINVNDRFDGGAPDNEGTYYQYPPTPYPRTVAIVRYPSPLRNDVVSHEMEYRFIVNASYEESEEKTPYLKRVTVEVRWTESSTPAGSGERKAVLSSRIFKR